MAKKTLIAKACVVDDRLVNLKIKDREFNFSSKDEMIETFIEILNEENVTSVDVKLEMCEDSIRIGIKTFNKLKNENNIVDYDIQEMLGIDDVGIRYAYALACLFQIKQLQPNEIILYCALQHMFRGGIDDKQLIKLNGQYSLVVNKSEYINKRKMYYKTIIDEAKIKHSLVDLDGLYSDFQKKVVEVDINGVIFYTLADLIDTEKYTNHLISETSDVILNGVKLDDVNGDESQYDAINSIAKSDSRLHVISAFPGAGKSATISKISEMNPGKVAIVAHFNTATNNIASRIGCGYSIKATKFNSKTREFENTHITKPMTIYRTFNSVQKKNIDVSDVEILIVDESSVISYNELTKIYYILEHCKAGCKLLFVGDINQCYPVRSRGLPMLEILHSNAKVHFLRKSHRMHPVMFEAINDCNKGWLNLGHEKGIVQLGKGSFVETYKYAYKKYSEAEFTSSFGMISFTNAVCKACNEYVDAEMLNKLGLKTDKYGNVPDYVGRRVRSKDTISEIGIAKNDIMTIKAMSKDSITFEKIDGSRITATGDKIPDLLPAWCCTVHSYQGSEVDEMLLLHDSAKARGAFWANRNNNVVALSRAKKTITVIDVANQKNNPITVNYDGLQIALVDHEDYVSPRRSYSCKSF